MKRLLFIFAFLSVTLFAQNLYFDAHKNVNIAKKLLKTNPDKAQRLFIEAYGYLKKFVNHTIENNRPSANGLNLLGEMYLNGWGVEKNEKKAIKLICAAKQLGNRRAKRKLQKMGIKCPKINFKELKQ